MFNHYMTCCRINGWFKAYLADSLWLGSILRHLLRKSKNILLSDPTLDFRLVDFGM